MYSDDIFWYLASNYNESVAVSQLVVCSHCFAEVTERHHAQVGAVIMAVELTRAVHLMIDFMLCLSGFMYWTWYGVHLFRMID